MTSSSTSFAEELAALVAAHPHGPALLAETLASLSDLEAAAIAYDWEGIWRRPKQTPPDGPWVTWGALTGRGFGKSLCNANWITGEVMAGRAMRVALIAQNEEKCLEVMVEGVPAIQSALRPTSVTASAPPTASSCTSKIRSGSSATHT